MESWENGSRDLLHGTGRKDQKPPPSCGLTRVVAVDGPAGSGKTTFAGRLARELDAQVIHSDDFPVPWDEPPAAWFGRVEDQVLGPLATGGPGRYERYDWVRGTFEDWVDVPVAPVLLLEGVSTARRTAPVPSPSGWSLPGSSGWPASWPGTAPLSRRAGGTGCAPRTSGSPPTALAPMPISSSTAPRSRASSSGSDRSRSPRAWGVASLADFNNLPIYQRYLHESGKSICGETCG